MAEGEEAALPVSIFACAAGSLGVVAQPAKKASPVKTAAETNRLKATVWKTEKNGGDKPRGKEFEEGENAGDEIDWAAVDVI